MHPNAAGEMTNYFGAKSGSGVAARIIAQMPPHDTYIEPFAGSAVCGANEATGQSEQVV